jgi:type II secretory pathway component GspD/PulD (secretin)/tetratricopeptide (TPR) repeat protein
VAKATKVAWMGLAVGLALTPAQAFAQQHGTPMDNIAVSGQQPVTVPSPSQTHVVLHSGQESYRKGDYEQAARFLQQAKLGEANLSADEKRDLASWQSLNNTALEARRKGVSQLQQAELAARNGKSQDAAAWIKAASPNVQFLTMADRQRLQQLADHVTPGAPKMSAATGTDSVSAREARNKLRMARQFMAKGNYDTAEAMAKEAGQMGAVFATGEDTPAHVLNDIVSARMKNGTLSADPKALLIAARAAMGRGDYDLAEKLAHQADKNTSMLSSMGNPFRSDTPAKVLKEVQVARSYAAANKSPGTSPAGAAHPGRTETASADPRLLVRQGRDLYNSSKLDEAEKVALRANAASRSVSWSYFEDTPEKLISDINKAKTKSNQEESVRVLAEARRQYAQGNLVEAEKLANRAERLHGPYGMMEMGDRPQKLLTEIETTRARNHISRVAPAEVAAKDTTSGTATHQPASATPYGSPQSAPKTVSPYGGSQVASQGAMPGSSLNPMPGSGQGSMSGGSQPTMPPNFPVAAQSSKSDAGMASSGSTGGQSPVVPAWPSQADVKGSVGMTLPSASSMTSADKAKAASCVAEARQLQREGRLVEAREKALQAQKMSVSFRSDEDRPEAVLMGLNRLCQNRVDALMSQADQHMKAGNIQMAEQHLSQAKQLAVGFSLDCYLIDMKTAQARQTSTRGTTTTALSSPNASTSMASTMGTAQGRDLLEKARLELRAGQTANARRLANEAFSPSLGVQGEATKLISDIDAEEFNQKLLVAERTFDAAVSAYNRHDYPQAMNMFRTIDPHHLRADKQARLAEYLRSEPQTTAVAQTSRWQDGQQSGGPVVPSMSTGGPVVPSMSLPTMPQAASTSFKASEAGMASTQSAQMGNPVATQQSADLMAQTKAMQEVKFQKLHNESLAIMSDARSRFQSGETAKAMDMLRDHIKQIEACGLDAAQVAMLKKQPEERLATFNVMARNKDYETAEKSAQQSFMANRSKEFLAEEAKKKQVAELMKQYHGFYKEHKYQQAEIAAIKAQELDPENYVIGAAVQTAHMASRHQEATDLSNRKEKYNMSALSDAEEPGPAVNLKNPLAVDPERSLNSLKRPGSQTISLTGGRSEKEREIFRKLDAQVTAFDYHDTPLQQVLDDLASWSQINIVPDVPALKDANISTAQPISMKMEGATLKSALNLLLHQAHLTYQVENDALVVTTEENAHGKLERKVFPVLDLVIPVLDSKDMGGAAVLQMASGGAPANNLKINGQTTPWTGMNSLQGGAPVGSGAPGASNGNTMHSVPASQVANQKDTIEDVLIKLIQNTISPQSWSSVGGPGTIEYFPLGKALVINQTPDIQEQVQELLNALRRLQDQEVAVEVKFITIAEAFYERIGLDFNVNITNNNSKYAPQIVSQQFAPFGFLNSFNPKNLVSGMTPAGNLTQDLGVPVNTSSFAMAVPPFGQFPNIPGGNGGVDLGIAFLSDIQVFLFMEAAQGDQRTNVMQAPKLTLFNGQTSTITIQDVQFFVTSVQVVQIGGQVVFVPTNTPVPTGGVTMTIQAVISADRRYVRMSLTPNLTNLASANITLFPITTFITPVFEGGAVGQPVPFTQFLQQPTFNSISVQTTVNVPDGGTVLLGGLKRLSEGRNEFGPPILSKIPYIDRLFKNVGYGRETTSLLMMVTPRIIINEEEEAKQVPGALPSANTQLP